jgi:type II secretory pathway component PulM
MRKVLAKMKRLNKREKVIVYGATGVLAALVIHQLIIGPFFENKARMTKNLHRKLTMVAEMQQWQSDFKAIKQNAQVSKSRFARRSKDFSLYSFLGKLTDQAGIKDTITYMRPTKIIQKNSDYRLSRVEMKLDGVGLAQLVKYLHAVETSANMVDITKLAITKKDKTNELISVVMQVQAIEI